MDPAIARTYIAALQETLSTGRAGEHAYRSALEMFFRMVAPTLKPVNDPKRTEHGAPDFVFVQGDLTVGYAETKDLGEHLDKTEKTEQIKRYLGYSNLILTNYLEFRLFRNGVAYGPSIVMGTLKGVAIVPRPENYPSALATIADFLGGEPETIKSAARLAEIMGGKARRIRDNVERFLVDNSDTSKDIKQVYEVVKKLLVHDLTPKEFADMYAQTLVYGLFVARFHDDSPQTFSRQKARDLVPASNPFLQHFFDHIVGPDFDKRLSYIVGELCEIFSHANVRSLMQQYFKTDLWGAEHTGPDPVIHFYEDFLREYDPQLRKKMGAYYTPLPVVRFIIRSVDEILERDFCLPQGLADTATTSVKVVVQGKKIERNLHRVQILDPAAGTGTFLNETMKDIHGRFKGQDGRWIPYVDDALLPRLYGFELMMTPYTISHLKLGMMLRETGYTTFNHRIGIYLTNSLEEAYKRDDGLFSELGLSRTIAEEAVQASEIKRERPIMVVIGNPPYSVSSMNKGEWIQNLIKPYKEGLGERKINLDDDYIKFLRFAEHFIERNGSGIVAMITNNSYIDGITHRKMREHFLETFDDVYILDLHGNSKKREASPDGSKDENVFDIQQGVAIAVFVRRGKKKGLGKIHHAELWGKREDKFKALDATSVAMASWRTLDPVDPYYFFVPKDFGAENEYKKGFAMNDIFNHEYNSGIQTKRDDTTIQFDEKSTTQVVDDFQNLSEGGLMTKYHLPPDGRDWKLSWAQEDLRKGFTLECILYRPFDVRWTAYTGRSKGFLAYPREKTNKHIVGKDNVSLLTSRTIPANQLFDRAFVTKKIADIHAASDQTYVFPLYLYSQDAPFRIGNVGNIPASRIPNINESIAHQIAQITRATWYPVAEYPTKSGDVRLTPEEIFDYIYAVLYSPSYREKYKEFLKIDFPRVPYPKDAESFKKLAEFGAELRSLHLLESPRVNDFVTTYPVAGSNAVEKVSYAGGKVFINGQQYFGGAPESVWNFYIGGYQPAQKWLKERKGRTLTNEDIEHYQKLVVALMETDRIMKEIDRVTGS